jgi:hypothetical protein
VKAQVRFLPSLQTGAGHLPATSLPMPQREGRTTTMFTDWPLPPSYCLDESDPDVVVLRRSEGTFVAAFSAQGASEEGILAATTPVGGTLPPLHENKEQGG